MTRYFARWNWVAAAIWAYLAASAAAYGAPLADATISPSQISLGKSAQLTVSTVGTGIDAVTIPPVPGLEFRVVEQSRRIEFVHGASLATTTTVFRVTPSFAGTFIIPAISPKSQPLVLRVGPADDTVISSRVGSPNRSPAAVAGLPDTGIHMTEDGSAYVRLTMPKREAYVGESIPIAIELGARAGSVASLNGLPALTGSDFTLNNLPREPDRTEKIIEGAPFVLLTWHTVLTAVKPGTFSFAVETPLTVKISTRPKGEAQLEDQFGDPFLQHLFGATVRKDIKVASPVYELSVQSLPIDGRPANFGGAVGTFKIASDLSPATAAAGDPLTLRMRVTGAGNFDRVDTPMLEHLDRWKTYPPKSSFTPGDALGYKGVKTFEQPVIASQPGAQTLPALDFSYFDPATRRYETARSTPLSVTISPSSADDSAPPPGIAAGGGMRLRPDHVVAEQASSTLVPLYLRAEFLTLPSLLGLAFAGGWLALRRRGPEGSEGSKPSRAAAKAARHVLARLKTAERSGDAALFLNSARDALVAAGTDGNDAEDVRQLFALADEVSYSDQKRAPVDFDRWTTTVRRQLLREKRS